METKEKNFEEAIENYLVNTGGYQKGSMAGYDATKALFMGDMIAFLEQTQPKEWAKFQHLYGEKAESQLYKTFENNVSQQGLIYVLRNGVSDKGVKLRFAFFKPASESNTDLVKKYKANILKEVRQFAYSKENHNTIDIGVVPEWYSCCGN